MERLAPGTSLLDHLNRDQAIGLACGLLRQLWRPLAIGHPFIRVAEEVARWGEMIAAMPRVSAGSARLDPALAREAVELCTVLFYRARR